MRTEVNVASLSDANWEYSPFRTLSTSAGALEGALSPNAATGEIWHAIYASAVACFDMAMRLSREVTCAGRLLELTRVIAKITKERSPRTAFLLCLNII